MGKFKNRAIALMLAAIITLVSAGCSGGGDPNISEKIDKTRTQLYVYTYAGGVGTQWLRDIKADFEAEYADQSFEEGKMGVQIVIDAAKTNGVSMINSVSASNNEVIFNEFVRYNEWVAQGKLLDISDIVTETGADGKTIASKLTDDQKSWLTLHGGKYYALPHYEVFRGIVYDMDLFASEKFYFADNRDYDDFILQSTSAKSAGPDGVKGTTDDGLPATMKEFFLMCDRMYEKGVTPFIWTGKYPAYSLFMSYALLDTFAGADEARLNYSFGVGTDKNKAQIVTGFSNGQPVVAEKVITEANGYEMTQSLARYRSIEFAYNVFNNSKYFYTDGMTNLTFSNIDAQQKYIFSKLENKPIAMLLEGTYWENEAADALSLSVEAFGNRAKNRSFGWMPMPTAYDGTVNAENGRAQVFNDYINAFCGINANIRAEKVALAKLFVKYCYTDSGLNSFTKATGMRKSLNYELSSDTLAALTPFSKQLSALRDEGTVISMHSESNVFINFETNFTAYEEVWGSVVGGQSYQYPISAFKDNKKDPVAYFTGLKMTQSTWNDRYGSHIGQ